MPYAILKLNIEYILLHLSEFIKINYLLNVRRWVDMTLFQRDRENRKIGFEEGYKKGFEEGYEEGFKEGLREAYEENAKIIKLYDRGMDKQEMSAELNLSLEIVEKIIRYYESV